MNGAIVGVELAKTLSMNNGVVELRKLRVDNERKAVADLCRNRCYPSQLRLAEP